MRPISLEACFEHAESLRGAIVLITGGASGFGSALALECSKYGAHVIIADVNEKALQDTLKRCHDIGGKCVTPPTLTDVTSVEAQEAMFQFILDNYARPPDVVMVNAGVSAADHLEEDTELPSVDGHSYYPKQMSKMTYDINLQGALTTAELAQQYWARIPAQKGHARRLVLTGSMSGFSAIPLGTTYTMSKHCITGYWKALSAEGKSKDFQCHLVAPYFSPTPILRKEILILLAGMATVEASSVMKAMFLAASDPSPSNGKAYLLLDHTVPLVLDASEYSPFDIKMISEIDDYVLAQNHPASKAPPTWGAIVNDVARINKTNPVGLFVTVLAGLAIPFAIVYGIVNAVNRLPTWATTTAGFAAAYLSRQSPRAKK